MDYLIGFVLGMIGMFVIYIFAIKNMLYQIKCYRKEIKEQEKKSVHWITPAVEEMKSEIEHWRKVLKTEYPSKFEGKDFRKGWRTGVNRVCNKIKEVIDTKTEK